MIVFLDSYTANPGDRSWDPWYKLGHEVHIFERTAPEDTIERCKGADIVLTNKVIISREVMEALPELRYIGVLATGYNVVDIEAAHERGIIVTNIPAYSTMSVAQMVFAHILNISNAVDLHASAVRKGAWQKSKDFAFQLTTQREISGKVLSIVGLGNTGLATARIGLSFGMKLAIFTSKSADCVRSLLGVANVQVNLGMGFHEDCEVLITKNVDDLFKVADFLSLNCPLTPSTKHLVNAERLKLMKPSAVVINTGRGPLVDEDALAEALQSKTIFAAGLDVLTQEPPRDGSPLLALDNCYITPHIAWATSEARERLLAIAIDNVKAFMEGSPKNVI